MSKAKPSAQKIPADDPADDQPAAKTSTPAAAPPAAQERAPDPKPAKAQAVPVKGKKTREELLEQIRAESEARVNLEHFLHDDDSGKNKYDIPDHLVPDGFTVEWKNTHIMGQPVPVSELAAHEMAGWRPAPAELFMEIMPEGYEKPTIERDGMILMIRPASITKQFRDKEKSDAKSAVVNKVNELNATKEGEMDRVVSEHKVSRVAIPGDED